MRGLYILASFLFHTARDPVRDALNTKCGHRHVRDFVDHTALPRSARCLKTPGCALSPCLVFHTYGQALTAAGIADGKQQGRMICCTGILANFFYERAGESGELADMLMACAACFLACTVMNDSRQELMQKEPVASKINNEAVDRDYPRLPSGFPLPQDVK